MSLSSAILEKLWLCFYVTRNYATLDDNFPVLFAIIPLNQVTKNVELLTSGRDPETSQLNLEKAGVEVHPQTKKIVGNNNEQTTASHIYAIGDVLQVKI